MLVDVRRFFSKVILQSAGFTMIELLVVIAVIGVLAVAVLSSINPIEQINKGRDTRTRSDAAQLINAVDRYFAIQEYYPWNIADASGNYTPAASLDVQGGGDYSVAFDFDPSGTIGTYTDWDWVNSLVDTEEVKDGFANRLKTYLTNFIVLKEDGSNETMYSCFLPTSSAFKREAADNCSNGTTPDGLTVDFCATVDGTVDDGNYICLP